MNNIFNQGGRPMGAQYAQQQAPQMTQPLKPEEIQRLRNRGGQFNIRLTQDEVLIAACTHKGPDGRFTLAETRDGMAICSICGQSFNLVNLTQEEVAERVNDLKDILQTIKTYYTDIPEDTAREFFVIQPMLDRVPQLYQIALDKFARYEQITGVNYNYGPNSFALLNNILAPGMMMGGNPAYNQGYPQQPQYQQQVPMGAPMPGYNPNYCAQPMGGNPFDNGTGYPQQQPQVQPQQQFQQAPQPQQQQPQYVETVAAQPNAVNVPQSSAKFQM